MKRENKGRQCGKATGWSKYICSNCAALRTLAHNSQGHNQSADQVYVTTGYEGH
jgi:hypothetical protein